MMRAESNGAPRAFSQLRVALLHGLTYKLFSLFYQIEAIKSDLEVRCAPLLVRHAVDDGTSAESRQTSSSRYGECYQH